MGEVTFKKAIEADFQNITDIFNYYVENSTAIAFYKPLPLAEVISIFNLKSPTTYTFCIYSDDIFCGFCLMKQYAQREGYKFTYEITIYLKPEYTGKGIGSIALSHLEGLASKSGVKTLVAGISSEVTSSIKLFEKHNYSKCGHMINMVHKFNRWHDTIYYQKLLEDV